VAVSRLDRIENWATDHIGWAVVIVVGSSLVLGAIVATVVTWLVYGPPPIGPWAR
jgi:hypothetical protein